MIAIAYCFFMSGVLTVISTLYAADGRWGIVALNTALTALLVGCAIGLRVTEQRSPESGK